ncbi:tetratricopeptide repeat protein [Porphyromonas pogonae]|uniref:tetratricopeptide repeat protein n=1 Tax=Porphyromonas pogonae TaxID=867595 RepID=UPI002E78574C|nr:tetratricopeptide repeat protein [Porphyromonas pogonae]
MAQGAKTDTRKGNKLFKKNSFTQSEIRYRKALQKDSLSSAAKFGLADALYKQNKQDEAINYYSSLAENPTLSPEKKADVMHNMGNIYMHKKDYAKSVEAYKQSLKLNPDDNDTRYNYVLARNLLKQQQQQQQQNNQNKDNNKDNKDKNKDQNKDQQQNNKDQDKKDDKQDKEKKDNNQSQGNPEQQEMSKQQAEQILNAYKQDEDNTREKIEKAKKEKAQQANTRIKKKW